MSDFLEALERELVAATRRTYGAPATSAVPSAPVPRRLRRAIGAARNASLRTVVATGLLVGVTASAGAAGTVLTLRGSVISAPPKEDVRPEQTPIADTVRVSDLRAADPRAGAPPWTIRIAKGRTGYVCSTVGQVQGGRFGLVGLDGRFRTLDPGASDSCGSPAAERATLVGARVFAARSQRGVRTVVNGLAPSARSVTLTAGGRTRPLRLDPSGAFVAVLAGYPEDLALQVRLTLKDGRVQTESLGTGDPAVVVDPAGGPAWRVQGSMLSGDARSCVSFSWARTAPGAAQSPVVCGVLRPVDATGARRDGAFFAVRRLHGRADAADRRSYARGDWHGRPARTAVWGQVGDEVTSVVILGAPGGEHRVADPSRRPFLAVFPGTVDPRDLRVRITTRDGATTTSRGDTNLTTPPTP
ncbi:hypothetical protein AB0L40_04115 [Patulibacter sp. NPDC049589]|uniref:hypothetical protein n=1 Tax=Patulibacter sp. NPDC049589 TaxID=3154731 RepID=UPI00344018F9